MFHSAYCGGLWLASLVVMCKMARLLENEMKYQYYRDILDRGSIAFDKLLWNGKLTTICLWAYGLASPWWLKCFTLSIWLGKYYNYDSSRKDHSNSVMSDQCAGHWFLRASGLGDGEYQASWLPYSPFNVLSCKFHSELQLHCFWGFKNHSFLLSGLSKREDPAGT